MNAAAQRDQARLWLAAFAASLAVNGIVVVALGLWMVGSLTRMVPRPGDAALVAPETTIATIMPIEAAAAPEEGGTAEEGEEAAAAMEPAVAQSFARTSPDQQAARPERARFMGERDTRAASDAPPVADAPELPSQKGEEPDYEGQIETTESVYQDGDLEHNAPATPEAVEPSPPEPPAEVVEMAEMVEPAEMPAAEMPAETEATARERLAEGPMPVDRAVKAEDEPEERPASAVARENPPEPREEEREALAETPPPKPVAPGFSGNQQKTRLQGSISRQGRSALDVEESLLGRYHAALSRAVEKEWQLNCLRNRDYITPGMLRVRFVLEADGKVRSVGFVEEFGVGTIQKGFTLNSIRNADIPPMPAELKKQLDGDPLEIIYNFIF